MIGLKGSAWLALSEFADFSSLVLTIPINFLLLYCICSKSPKEFGGYKYLMMWFTVQSIFFSVVAAFTHMSFHTIGGTFMMFTINNRANLPAWGVWVLLEMCCISVGYVLFILSAQFVYRYFAMSNASSLRYFTGWRRLYFVLIMILVAVVYGGCGFVRINLTPERDRQIRQSMATAYEVTPEEIYYVAVEYYVRDGNNEIQINWLSIGTAAMLNAVFGSMVFVIICCGIKTYQGTQVRTCHLSNHMNIQRQLFTALLVQTLTPTILIFIPCIIFYVLPIFEIPLGVNANILSISLVFYPTIDPIGVMFIIKNYRNFLNKFFYRRVFRRSRCDTLKLEHPHRPQRAIGSADSEQNDSLRFDNIQN
ncbi:unnamed protein product [Caenorhabditis sp. 36 PRJEB53466]|nr:unnamed protein product [Caenorhabditis sp. 36 PRJEB53466]